MLLEMAGIPMLPKLTTAVKVVGVGGSYRSRSFYLRAGCVKPRTHVNGEIVVGFRCRR